MLGGRIWVESQPGKGSSFHFTARFGIAKESKPARRHNRAEDRFNTRELSRAVSARLSYTGVMSIMKRSRAPRYATATQSRFANVNGARLHYLAAGTGDPVVLLHGYAETSHMWRPLIAKLAETCAVIAPDLRGAGESSKPIDGYTKAEMARDIHALVDKLGLRRIRLVGHDIGLMVAYAYAAQFPKEVDRIALHGRLPAGCRRLAQRLAHAGYVAFPLLRKDPAGLGARAGTHLFRAFLERFRRRPPAFR